MERNDRVQEEKWLHSTQAIYQQVKGHLSRVTKQVTDSNVDNLKLFKKLIDEKATGDNHK